MVKTKLPLRYSCITQMLSQPSYVIINVDAEHSSSSSPHHLILTLMEHHSHFIILISFYLFLLHLHLHHPTSHAQLLPIVDDHENETQIYIIDVERHEHHDLLNDEDIRSWHASFLPNSTLDSGAPRLIYSYRHVISGFAARLTPGELDVVKSKPGFLRAQRERIFQVQTTYTPRYLGLTTNNAWGSTMMGEGIIIGILDTGIKPSHPSFSGTNMPPPPPSTKWKGNCTYKGFKCNKKIIGAIAFRAGTHPSPVDQEGHGTHVASIAAGSFVKNANVLGTATGTASGMAPMAYLSIYRVCFPKLGCPQADSLAALDQAIKDGVDVINMSISGYKLDFLYEDVLSRGSMAAIQHGIVPVVAAGNYGPYPETLCHSAPWMITVGATTTDRRIGTIVELGDHTWFLGESAYQPKTWNSKIFYPLEYAGIHPGNYTYLCNPKALANLNFRGKIVICETGLVGNVEKGEAVYKAGAEGMIIVSQFGQGYSTFSEAHVLPTAYINYPDGIDIKDYYNKKKANATATIHFQGTQFGFMPSPAVVYFSSRGPSLMNGGVIKPDVLAPGVNILAAYIKDVGPNPNPLATHTFNFMSGTSMASPHVAGIAALIRSKHRGWTPSEILSAVVTTADDSWKPSPPANIIIDELNNNTAGIYTTGAGQVNPIKAMDPGLVFGVTLNDYVAYLCGLGYDDTDVTLTIGKKKTCSGVKNLTATELNYPSVTVNLTRTATSQKVKRTAKNVGDPREEYAAKITQPAGVNINLSTYRLKFVRVNQELSYEMTFSMSGRYPGPGSDLIRRGKIVWDSGKHSVTTPIAIRFV